jgi:hypothetical protein
LQFFIAVLYTFCSKNCKLIVIHKIVYCVNNIQSIYVDRLMAILIFLYLKKQMPERTESTLPEINMP